MRAILVARKSLLEFLREWQLLLLTVLLPLAFLVITAFGYSAPLLVTHPILVMGTDPQAARGSSTVRRSNCHSRRNSRRPFRATSKALIPAASAPSTG